MEFTVYALKRGNLVVYVGMTRNLSRRLYNHFGAVRKYMRENPHVSVETLGVYLDKREAMDAERDAIYKLQPAGNTDGKYIPKVYISDMPVRRRKLVATWTPKGIIYT